MKSKLDLMNFAALQERVCQILQFMPMKCLEHFVLRIIRTYDGSYDDGRDWRQLVLKQQSTVATRDAVTSSMSRFKENLNPKHSKPYKIEIPLSPKSLILNPKPKQYDSATALGENCNSARGALQRHLKTTARLL